MPIHKKTIIAVWNKGSQGKTTSIRYAASMLIQRPNISIASGDVPHHGEIRATMVMSTSLGDVIISFESQGDPNTSLENRLEQLIIDKADIIICATRTSGGTVDAVDNVAGKYGYQVLWLSTLTSGSALQAPLNKMTGNHIVSIIDNIVLGVL